MMMMLRDEVTVGSSDGACPWSYKLILDRLQKQFILNRPTDFEKSILIEA